MGWVEKLSGLADLGRASRNPHFNTLRCSASSRPLTLAPTTSSDVVVVVVIYIYLHILYTHTHGSVLSCLVRVSCHVCHHVLVLASCKPAHTGRGVCLTPKSQQHFDQRSKGTCQFNSQPVARDAASADHSQPVGRAGVWGCQHFPRPLTWINGFG